MTATTLRQSGCRVRVRTNSPSQIRVKGRIVHVTEAKSPIKVA